MTGPMLAPWDRAWRSRSVAFVVVVAIVSLAAATVAAAIAEGALGVADASPIYLLAVVLLAGIGGTWAAVATSIASVLVYDLLFTDPRLTLTVADPAEWLSLLLFLAVAVVIGRMAALLRDRAETAERRTREAQSLVAISRALASAPTAAEARSEIEWRLQDAAEMSEVWVNLAGAQADAHTDAHTFDLRPWDLLRNSGEDGPGEWVRVDGGEPARSSIDAAEGRTTLAAGAMPGGACDAYRTAIEVDGRTVGWLWATRELGSPMPGRGARRILALTADQLGAAIHRDELRAEATASEVARQGDALRAALLDSVSHDLRTPLASIRGYAQQLEGETPDRRLGIITEQADRLSRMVRQLLMVSRIESGALKPRQEVFAPAARVRRTWEALGAADVPFTLEDASEGWLALADADQLDQVLWAILDNAVSYGNRSAISALVRVDTTASRVSITIADHGPGVTDEDRDRLFKRFERGAERPTGEGSGLGLYVSRELCRAMNGDLVLEPTVEGTGAALTIRLPAEAPEES